VRQERLKSDAPEFDTGEKHRLIDYFLADCSGGEDSKEEDVVGEIEANYPAYVNGFVMILNKKGSEYTNPRRIIWRLWKAGSLRKCQLLSAFTYAYFCIERSRIDSNFSSWFTQIASIARATQKAQLALKGLENALQQQGSRDLARAKRIP
jgi:hypothetical protein